VIRRLFWLVMGITIGVLVVRKLSRAAERMSPSGLAHSFVEGVGDLTESVRDFGADVRTAMKQQEAALREGAGFDGELGRRDGR
jgi:hypothetical protein